MGCRQLAPAGGRARQKSVSAVVLALLWLGAVACVSQAGVSSALPAAVAPETTTTAVATQHAPIASGATATAVATQHAPIASGLTPDRPFGARTHDSGCAVRAGLPDNACTPGAVFPDATAAQICRPGYSSSVRNVPSEVSRMVYAEYGITERNPGDYEVDHLVPLELGGSNDIANLWPEAAAPPPGFRQKDQVENYLHDQVCGGSMGLLDAQRAIATNWVDVFQHLPQRVSATPVPTTAPAPQPGSASDIQLTSVTGGRPGGRASVAVHTTPGTSCSISYRTPAGTPSTAQGLEPRTSDSSGNVTWSWNIGGSTRPGSGTVIVTCGGNSVSSPIQIG